MEDKCNLPEDTKAFAALLFQDKIYVALKVKVIPNSWIYTKPSMLYCSSGQLLSWNRLTTFDVVDFGLGAYQSKLVRVGGFERLRSRWSAVSSVLVSGDGKTWQYSFPPLPTRRAHPMVVPVGRNPEYLVVAGGRDYCDYSSELEYLPTVEVLAEGQWYTLQSFPDPCGVGNHCFHNGKLFMTLPHTVFFCKVETLLAQCTECVAGKEPRSPLWKTIDDECDATKFCCDDFIPNTRPTFCASLGGYFVVFLPRIVDAYYGTPHFSNMIWAHSPYTKSWICIAKSCTSLGFIIAVLVSRGSELVLFGEDTNKVLKTTLYGKVP